MKTKSTYRLFHILISLLMVFSVSMACGTIETVEGEPVIEPTRAIVRPTQAPAATRPAGMQPTRPVGGGQVSPQDQTWLILLYQDADDEILEKDIYLDLNEAEIVGSNDRVKIVSQIDRYVGAFRGDGNWADARRYLVTQDSNFDAIGSQLLAEIGEVDSGDYRTLVDFATWGIQNYPADKVVLILSDHGSGWLGGWSDDDPRRGSKFTTNDIDQALSEIINQTGIPGFEMVGFDACLMSQVEVMSMLAPYARYTVASEETEPALGWAYSGFLAELVARPEMTGAELAESVVSTYIAHDWRITDDQARRVFIRENFNASGNFSANQVAGELMNGVTLAAIDLSAMTQLNSALNDLAVALQSADQRGVAQARTYAQSYTSVFGERYPPSYIDIGHFVSLLEETLPGNSQISSAIQAVRNALQQAVLSEIHGKQRPGSTGLSIFFPNSTVFRGTFNPNSSPNYSKTASRFAVASLWDDFVLAHYTGQAINPGSADLTVLAPVVGVVQPEPGTLVTPAPETGEVVAPGSGNITIKPITLSSSTVSPQGTVMLSTEISGQNVGYLYIYVLYYDQDSASYQTADIDYIASETTKEMNGVYYPDWGAGVSFPLDFEWSPTVFFLNNGGEEVFAVLEPETYGVGSADTFYTVRGYFTFSDSGEKRNGYIRFNGEGKLDSIWGYTNADGTGSPRQITPLVGDTFTVFNEWLEFTPNPDGEFVDYEGGVITFSDQPLEFVGYDAPPSDYLLAIIVEDLDGNTTLAYAQVTVTE
ncbi:MAG: hypothetical protein JXB15_04040 [Anaerolineales bacterium]|nr:hypothetical protein [Anaerolineales bacterium]